MSNLAPRETHPQTGYRSDFVTVIVDLTPTVDGVGPAGLLDVVPGCTKQVLAQWLQARSSDFQTRVEVMIMDDGFVGYASAVKQCLPDAVAIMESFHVVQLVSSATSGKWFSGDRKVVGTGPVTGSLVNDRSRKQSEMRDWMKNSPRMPTDYRSIVAATLEGHASTKIRQPLNCSSKPIVAAYNTLNHRQCLGADIKSPTNAELEPAISTPPRQENVRRQYTQT